MLLHQLIYVLLRALFITLSMRRRKKWAEAELVRLAHQLREPAFNKPVVSLYAQAASQIKTVLRLLLDFASQDSCIIWLDVINNTVKERLSDPGKKLTSQKLLDEIGVQPKVIGLVYCHRQLIDNILSDLQTKRYRSQ